LINKNRTPVVWYTQGDQIGRIFAYWAIVFSWLFFITNDDQVLGLFFHKE
jgi:hypothetical protein